MSFFFFPSSPFCIPNGFREHIVSPIQIHDPVLQVEFPFVLTSVNLRQRQNESTWASRAGGHHFISAERSLMFIRPRENNWIPGRTLALILQAQVTLLAFSLVCALSSNISHFALRLRCHSGWYCQPSRWMIHPSRLKGYSNSMFISCVSMCMSVIPCHTGTPLHSLCQKAPGPLHHWRRHHCLVAPAK